MTKNYDVIIVGGGACGLFAAYEFAKIAPNLKVCILEKGSRLEKRKCPIDGDKIKNCINCKDCSIMTGIGGAGAFSDGKYNITTEFGGNFHEYVGKEKAIELMKYVDSINMSMGGEGSKLYPAANSELKRKALQYDLHILDANIRHLGTDKNHQIIKNMVQYLEDKVDIFYNTPVITVKNKKELALFNEWLVETEKDVFVAKNVIIATGRSGSKWTAKLCDELGISKTNNRVDIGVRFECPAEVWEPLTNEVYESKIIYRSPRTGCTCRTFCMNPRGSVVSENTNGIVTVNGHSYEDPAMHTKNTNFALLVTHQFTEPFKDSNRYGEHVAEMVNMLSGGVMVQRFGDLVANRRTTEKRLEEAFITPTLKATPGNLALAIPKMTLDTVIDMIYALDHIAPGTANGFSSLLYGCEVKFYNSTVSVDNNLESQERGLFFAGDCGGTSHSLSAASAEGVFLSRLIAGRCTNDKC